MDDRQLIADLLSALECSVAIGLIEVTQGADGEWLFKLNDAGMGVGKHFEGEDG